MHILNNLLRYIINTKCCILSATCCGISSMRSIAYHQPEGLYLIKPQGVPNARVRVMIYNKGRPRSAFVDEMHAARDDMPSLRLG